MNENTSSLDPCDSLDAASLSNETVLVLVALDEYIRSHGMSPALRELTRRLGSYSPTAARHHLLKLAEHGLVTLVHAGPRQQIVPRSVRLTEAGRRFLERHQQSASILHGECELRLGPLEQQAARAVGLPLDTLPATVDSSTLVVRLADAGERDFWAYLILERLVGK